MNLNRMMYWMVFVVMIIDFPHEGTLLKSLIALGIGFTALWMDAVYSDKIVKGGDRGSNEQQDRFGI